MVIALPLVGRSVYLLVVHEVTGDGDENKFLTSPFLAAFACWLAVPIAVLLPARLDGRMRISVEELCILLWCGPAVVPLMAVIAIVVGVLLAAFWKASLSHRVRAIHEWWTELRAMRDVRIGAADGPWSKDDDKLLSYHALASSASVLAAGAGGGAGAGRPRRDRLR